MLLEAILTREDLVRLVSEFLPLKIDMADPDADGRLILVTEVSELTLLPNVGARVVCRGDVRWPLLGISVPIHVHSATLLVRPTIEARDGRDALVFHLELTQADLAGVPGMLDARITEKANAELGARSFAWSFTKTLTHAFKLPAALADLEAFELGVAGSQLKITDSALALGVFLRSSVKRLTGA